MILNVHNIIAIHLLNMLTIAPWETAGCVTKMVKYILVIMSVLFRCVLNHLARSLEGGIDMKKKIKTFIFPDSIGKAETWIQKHKNKPNVIVLSSNISDENYGRRIAYVCYDNTMTDRDARNLRKRERRQQ